MRYKIILSYNGGKLCGWQKQNNADTVQGCIEQAISTLLASPVEITGAGRTDTGVNAISYVAHFDVAHTINFDADNFCYKLNAILPKEITVHRLISVQDDFHARFDALSREYHYFIHFGKDPFADSFSYQCRFPLDLDAMNEAASYLMGEHDFSCFEKSGGNNATSLCNVMAANWKSYRPTHVELMHYPAAEGKYIVFTIRANRFLRNMVRAIVGSLIEVGRGKRKPEWIAELIASGTRSDAGNSVPGKALFLSEVEY